MSQFFISGVQRSGTTLLSVMLSNHPDILMERRVMAFQIITTIRSLYDLLPYNMDIGNTELLRRIIENDSKSRLPQLLDLDLLPASKSITEWIEKSIDQKLLQSKKKVWGDKAPNLEHYYNDVKLILPKAKTIHIIRDGRPVAYSMHNRASTNLLLSAQRWVDGNNQALVNQQIVGDDMYLIITYENLLTRPEETLRKVCSFLGLDFDDRILEASDNQVAEGKNYVKQQIDKSKIDKWKDQLSKKEIKQIEEIQGACLSRFDYTLETPSADLIYRPLSAFRFLLYRFGDNIKSLFVSKRIGMVDRKNVEIKIPLKNRLYSFLKVGVQILLSHRIYKAIFFRDHRKTSDYRK